MLLLRVLFERRPEVGQMLRVGACLQSRQPFNDMCIAESSRASNSYRRSHTHTHANIRCSSHTPTSNLLCADAPQSHSGADHLLEAGRLLSGNQLLQLHLHWGPPVLAMLQMPSPVCAR